MKQYTVLLLYPGFMSDEEGELALTENRLPTKHKPWWKFWSKRGDGR